MKITHAFPFRFFALLATSAIAASPALRAHSVWIEDTPEKNLVVRFGEPGEAPEKSPGHLDDLAPPASWTIGSEGKPAAFTIEKKADHFLLVAAQPAAAAFAETAYPVMAHGKNPPTKPLFYLRWLPAGITSAAEPALQLDLVPKGEAGVFLVAFRGQPLPEAKLTLHVPGEKEAKFAAGTDGRVRLPLSTKPGLYLLTANHREPLGGFAGGKAYESVSHNVSVAWYQP